MSFVHIKSQQPALVYIDGSVVGEISEKNHSCLDLEATSSFMLFALPVSKSLPITTMIDLSSCNKPSDDVKLIPFYNNHFDIHLKWSKNKSSMPIKELAYFALGDKSIGVYNNGATYICAYLNGSLKFATEFNKEFSKANIEEINDNYCVVVEDFNEKHAVVLNSELQMIFNDEVSIIEKSSDNISLLSPLHDLVGHCKVSILGKENKTYFVYEDNFPKYIPPSLCSLALLQCVKVKNVTLASDLLSSSISDKAKNLSEYMGEIEEIYYNSYSPNKQNYTVESNNNFKSFSFITDNGKIKDIQEEDFSVE